MHGLWKLKKGMGTRMVFPGGAAFPLNPQLHEVFFRDDLLQLFMFLGAGAPGTTADGWFSLHHAYYSA